MQFIRLPKAIDIAERVLPELVVDWMNTKSVQNINISFVQKLQVNMLISGVIKWLKSWMPHRRTFRNFTHQAWAIWDMSNYDMSSAKNISVRAEWLRQSGRAPSEPSETPWWQTTPRPAPIRRVALHIALRSQFRRFFPLCPYSILNDHCGIVANCDHTSEWVHWVHQQNVNWSGSHMQGFISTRHFVYHICLCYSHKIRYLIIWHALFQYLYIYT